MADVLSEVRSTKKEQSPHERELRLLRLRNWGNRSLDAKERFPQIYESKQSITFFYAANWLLYSLA